MGDGMEPGGLSGLRAVRHHEDDWLVAVELWFDEGVLLVEVNPDDDDVRVSLTPDAVDLVYWPDARCVDVTGTPLYAGLRGAGSTWRWLLRNQQGYTDAFQIELGRAGEETTLQYLAIASRLEVRLVSVAP